MNVSENNKVDGKGLYNWFEGESYEWERDDVALKLAGYNYILYYLIKFSNLVFIKKFTYNILNFFSKIL